MEGKVFLSCGHEDHYHPFGFPVIFKDYDKYGNPCLNHSTYCSKCYGEMLIEHPDLVVTEFERPYLDPPPSEYAW